MKKRTKRLVAALLCLLVTVGAMPAAVYAQTVQQIEPMSFTCINPLYADVIDESDLVRSGVMLLDEDEEYYTDMSEAAEELREKLVNREKLIMLNVVYVGEVTEEAMVLLFADIFDRALEHTGDPEEGDYLRWQYGGYELALSGHGIDDIWYLTLHYNVTYYTTEEQEKELDREIKDLLQELDLKKKSDYEKIRTIYDWMTANITYDYKNLNKDKYTLKYTAYAAMMNRTAVCQGYATLLYRLLLESDVDCRLVTGDAGGAHGWNIVGLNGEYYNADVTWDAGREVYSYFMVSDDTIGTDHTRDAEYATAEFYAAYPMAAQDLDPDELPPVPGGGEITSSVYTIEDGALLGVAPGTTVDELLENLEQGKRVQVFDGTRELSGDDIVTGTAILAMIDDQMQICSLSVVLLGDVNRDGSVDNLDATAVLQSAANWDVNADVRLADANGDESVDNLDATLILQYAAGWEVSFGE